MPQTQQTPHKRQLQLFMCECWYHYSLAAQHQKPNQPGPGEFPLPPTGSIPTLVLQMPLPSRSLEESGEYLGGKVGGGGFFSQKRPGHPAHQEAEINSTEEGLNNASWINDSQAINPYTLQPQGCVTHKITTSPSLLFLWCVFSKRRKPSQQGGWQRNKSRLDEGRREQRSKAREKGQKVEEMEGRWEISGRTKALASSAKH